MTAAPTAYDWVSFFGILALGATSIVALSATIASLVRHAAWCRMSWRLAVVGLVVLLGAELTGVTRGVGCWTISLCSPMRLPADSSITGASKDQPIESGDSCEDDSGQCAVVTATGSDEVSVPSSVMDGANESDFQSSTHDMFLAWVSDVLRGRTWWPGIVWLSGIVLLVGRLVLTRVVAQVQCWQRPLCNDKGLFQRFHGLARRLGLSAVRTVVVPEITGPIAFGVIRPTVGVPPCFTSEFDETQQVVMVAHELEHLAARDPAWYLLTDSITAILWWHPLVWWLRRRLRRASEWAADEASLVIHNGPEVLAACLVQLGGRLLRQQRHSWLGIEGGGFRSSLGQRVTRLLSLSEHPRRHPGVLQSLLIRVSSAAAMVFAVLVSTGWSNAGEIPKGESMRLTLLQSWRQSLAAVTLFAVFGNANAPAQGAPMPDELLLGYVHEPNVQKEADEPSKRQLVEHSQAILEKLEKVQSRIHELEEKGDLDAAKRLSAERDELKAALEKIQAEAKARISIEGKRTAASELRKSALDSDELRERLKQLELENAKLREALAEMRRKVGGGDKGREEAERERKELMELHEKLNKARQDAPKKEDLDRVKLLYEKALRDQLDRAKVEKAPVAQEEGAAAFHEKMKLLAEEREKLKEKGRLDEAEKIHADMRKLSEAAEKAAKLKSDSGFQTEVGAMLKDLREEVSRLRNEVSELRQMVKESDSKNRGR